MADICIIYASEDDVVVQKLVLLLRRNWDVWWAEDITHGNWEARVRSEISKTKAVVPVFSHHTENKSYFKDELKFAEKQNRLIFPFFIDKTEPPFGFGDLNRTSAFGWDGDENHHGYLQLQQKITVELGRKLKRVSTLQLHNKILKLPLFVFSLSSFETQVRPIDGVKLFQLLEPDACLISAYDVWKSLKDNNELLDSVKDLRQSRCTLFLDSGNYEAYRKKDQYSEENKNGWRSEYFRQIAGELSPDIAFAFDKTDPKGTIDEVAEQIALNFHEDVNVIHPINFPLCPIVHLPVKKEGTLAECASQLIVKVASTLDPVMVAIPERELGDGLKERFMTVLNIRKALNNLGKYYPLHLLGTGNPISMVALAAAGADSFDGLEWCRTVADYDNGILFHFQHFDCFIEIYRSRLRSQEIRRIIEDPKASYIVRVLSYNIDFYNEWIKTIQDMIDPVQVEHLLKNVPNIGTMLFRELLKWDQIFPH